jgi:hypothetical protein
VTQVVVREVGCFLLNMLTWIESNGQHMLMHARNVAITLLLSGARDDRKEQKKQRGEQPNWMETREATAG